MSLRDQAAADLRAFLEDTEDGFAIPITVTDPAGTSVELAGFAADIGQTFDPDTGQAVAGRRASVAISIAALLEAGIGTPKGIANSSTRPWVVAWTGADGVERHFKVSQAMPDELGVVTCILEVYKP